MDTAQVLRYGRLVSLRYKGWPWFCRFHCEISGLGLARASTNRVTGSFLVGGGWAGLAAYFLAEALGVRGKILECDFGRTERAAQFIIGTSQIDSIPIPGRGLILASSRTSPSKHERTGSRYPHIQHPFAPAREWR